jgi:hypothetical protein
MIDPAKPPISSPPIKNLALGIVTGVGEARLPAIRPHPPHSLGSALDKLEKGYEGSLQRLLGKVISYVNHQLGPILTYGYT